MSPITTVATRTLIHVTGRESSWLLYVIPFIVPFLFLSLIDHGRKRGEESPSLDASIVGRVRPKPDGRERPKPLGRIAFVPGRCEEGSTKSSWKLGRLWIFCEVGRLQISKPLFPEIWIHGRIAMEKQIRVRVSGELAIGRSDLDTFFPTLFPKMGHPSRESIRYSLQLQLDGGANGNRTAIFISVLTLVIL